MSNYFWREGSPEQAVAAGLDALAIAETHGDIPLQVTAKLRLGQGYHGWGRYEEAVACLACDHPVANRPTASLRGDRLEGGIVMRVDVRCSAAMLDAV
jgi:hypothetical protein